ncbi:MAG: PH domain-containing protein [Sphingorhabdus sp.]
MAEPRLGDEGQRTHPLGLAVGFITGLPQLFFPMLAAVYGSGGMSNPGLIPLVIFIVLLASLFFRWIAWRRTHYMIGDDDIRIESGILSRTARSIPYDRIQDVSVEQKPLARLFALGEVKFESGGGEGEDAKLSFVSLEEAERLRETVRTRKAGAIAADHAVVEAEETETAVFAMDTARLVTLGFFSFNLVIFAILGGLAQQFDFLIPFDWWDFKRWIGVAEENGVDITHIDRDLQIAGALFALGALIVIGFASGLIRTFLTEYGFRLTRTPKGFRRRRGLLTLTDVVMPVARVQAAVVTTGPIRKLRGWHALKFVSLAQESKEESDHMVAPLAKLEEIWPIAGEAGISAPETDAAFRRAPLRWWLVSIVVYAVFALLGAAGLALAEAPLFTIGLLVVPALLFLPLPWLEWRHYGDHADERQLYVHEHWWRQRLTVAPQLKVQSAEIRQGPIARMLGLSTLHFGIAGGNLSFIALPLAEARAIRDQVMAVVVPVDFSESNRRG